MRRIFTKRWWERGGIALIALGFVTLMQPVALSLYSFSFPVLLVGVVAYSVGSKLR